MTPPPVVFRVRRGGLPAWLGAVAGDRLVIRLGAPRPFILVHDLTSPDLPGAYREVAALERTGVLEVMSTAASLDGLAAAVAAGPGRPTRVGWLRIVDGAREGEA